MLSLLKVPITIVEEALAAMPDGKEKTGLSVMRHRTSLRRLVEFSPSDLSKKQIGALYKVAKKVKGEQRFKSELEFLYNAARDPSTIKVTRVLGLPEMMKTFMQDGFIKGYVFERAEHGALTPYLITGCTYTPPSKYVTEHVDLTLVYTTSEGTEQTNRKVISENTLVSAYKAMNREAAEKVARELEAQRQQDIEDEEEDEDSEDGEDTKPRKKRVMEMRHLMLSEGVPLDRLLAEMGFYKETDELHTAYQAQVDRFMIMIKMYGKQLRVRGEGQQLGGWSWYNRDSSMLVDGRVSRAIMDTRPLTNNEDESSGKKRRVRRDEDDETSMNEDETVDASSLVKEDFLLAKVESDQTFYKRGLVSNGVFQIPLHLNLKIFHLEKHEFYSVHVANLAPYKYKKDIIKHLILPDKVIQLAEMLVGGDAEEEAEDVIEGKSQGTLVACIGDPGLGKTLLAEVISEQVQKPLYKIQASQLGLDPESLEAQLKILLHRAERWDSVLMIDEANAYVHDRGTDIQQNAIVGVFLRLLEYYRGILILTTNQTGADGVSMDIDDAILQRMGAVIYFKLPTPEASKKIWKLQCSLLKHELSDKVIARCVETFIYSGRSIRQLVRLAGRLARKEKAELTFERLYEASEFIAISRQEKVIPQMG